MKKILLTLLGVICSLGMWADTEVLSKASADKAAVIGTSFTTATNMMTASTTTNSNVEYVKMRTNQNSNTWTFTVNEGYEINGIKIVGWSNNSAATATIDMTSMKANDTEVLESKVTFLPNKTLTACEKTFGTALTAGQTIVCTFDNSNIDGTDGSKNAQLFARVTITYTQKEVITQEITAVTLNGSAISDNDLATLKSDKIVTIDGSSLNGLGNLGVTLSSGSVTPTRTIANGVATYKFTINSTDEYTVKVNNFAKTYSKAGNVLAYKEDDTEAEGKNSSQITLNGVTATYASKTFQYGAGSVTLGSNKYVPLKLSTGEAFNITFPDGYVATKVTVYGWSQSGNGQLTAFKETSESTDKAIDVSNDIYYAGNSASDIYPSAYTYTLDNWTSVYATGGGSASQPFIVMDFTLVSTKTASDLAVSYDQSQITLPNTTDITYTTSSTGDVTVKSSDEAVAKASVNKETKTITIYSVAAGNATITVSQEADDTYAAGEKTISVTVTDPYAGTVVYDLATGVGSQEVGNNTNVTLSDEGKSTCMVKFASSLNTDDTKKTNYLRISPAEGTFKAGDVVSFTGYYNNKEVKESAITIYKNSVEDDNIVLEKSAQFANINTTCGETPKSQSFTLTSDANDLFIGRNGGTTTFLYGELKVSRPAKTNTITTNENGVASFVTTEALDFTGFYDLTAYLATDVTSTNVVLAKATKVPAGTALVVKGTANTNFVVPAIASADDVTNIFKGSAYSTFTADGNTYALNTSGNFQQVASGVVIPAGKAYIQTSSSAKILTLDFGNGTTTAIQNVDADVNANNGAAYNLAGQRVNASAKGIVIINGKKYINK